MSFVGPNCEDILQSYKHQLSLFTREISSNHHVLFWNYPHHKGNLLLYMWIQPTWCPLRDTTHESPNHKKSLWTPIQWQVSQPQRVDGHHSSDKFPYRKTLLETNLVTSLPTHKSCCYKENLPMTWGRAQQRGWHEKPTLIPNMPYKCKC